MCHWKYSVQIFVWMASFDLISSAGCYRINVVKSNKLIQWCSMPKLLGIAQVNRHKSPKYCKMCMLQFVWVSQFRVIWSISSLRCLGLYRKSRGFRRNVNKLFKSYRSVFVSWLNVCVRSTTSYEIDVHDGKQLQFLRNNFACSSTKPSITSSPNNLSLAPK